MLRQKYTIQTHLKEIGRGRGRGSAGSGNSAGIL